MNIYQDYYWKEIRNLINDRKPDIKHNENIKDIYINLVHFVSAMLLSKFKLSQLSTHCTTNPNQSVTLPPRNQTDNGR